MSDTRATRTTNELAEERIALPCLLLRGPVARAVR